MEEQRKKREKYSRGKDGSGDERYNKCQVYAFMKLNVRLRQGVSVAGHESL